MKTLKWNDEPAHTCQNCLYYNGGQYLPCAVHPMTDGSWTDCKDWAEKLEGESQEGDRLSPIARDFLIVNSMASRYVRESLHRLIGEPGDANQFVDQFERPDIMPPNPRRRITLSQNAQMTISLLKNEVHQPCNGGRRGIEAMMIRAFVEEFPEMINPERLWGNVWEDFGARYYEDVRSRVLDLARLLGEALSWLDHDYAVDIMTDYLRRIEQDPPPAGEIAEWVERRTKRVALHTELSSSFREFSERAIQHEN
jgi:hypothetical protein